MSDASKRQVLAAAERVFDADPANVWAMIADPSRVGEWAGVVMVGYMGTELPKVGHNLFVRPSWRRQGNSCAVLRPSRRSGNVALRVLS